MKMEKASILCRVSTKDKSELEQEPECKDYVEKMGWNLFNVYYEKGSAYKLHFDERETFQQMLKEAKENNVKHFVFWNMDRYSRLPEDEVMNYTKKLSFFDDIQIHAVHGDSWSELVETISKIKSLGFVGDALSEFLEKIIKGMEHQRAHRESKVKSQRVKLKVVKSEGKPTKSIYGNKWGKKSLPKQTISKILELHELGLSQRKICKEVWIYDKHGNKKKNVSLGKVNEVVNGCSEIHPLKTP